jgi:FkbH-like protein
MEFKEIQHKISNIYADTSATAGDYISVGKKLLDFQADRPQYIRKTRVAFLSSFTIQGLPEVFSSNALFHNLFVNTYNAPYNQFTQEILNVESGLYKFNPYVIYILIDARDIRDNKHIEDLVSSLSLNTNAKIVFSSFAVSPKKYDNTAGVVKVKELNKILREAVNNFKNFSIFDFEDFLQRIGKDEYWYTKFTELGDIRLTMDAFPALSEEFMEYIVARMGATKKCLVLDLDNTLWKGIVGEDGVQNIIPDVNLQEYILTLYEKGILLAINSKNNKKDALDAINNHPDMLLKKEHFAAYCINWNDKASNMRELAKELNLSLDSFVFVDDSAFEQDLVRSSLPEIAVVPIDRLKTYAGFASGSLTKEDKKRSQMYKDEKKRDELKVKSLDVNDYLKTLELKVKIKEASEGTLPRISQLTQKTNQFNLATRRYSEVNIRDFIKKGWKVWTLEASDKFGDYGIVGVVVLEPKDNVWRIDTLLLSCRILGRKIEETFFEYILENARKEQILTIVGEFIPTQKNKPSEAFLTSIGFKEISKNNKMFVYEYDTKQDFERPDFIELN